MPRRIIPATIQNQASVLWPAISHLTAGHGLTRNPHPDTASSHPTGGDEEKDFDIQRNTGTLSVARRLDASRRSNYNMTVRVTDGHQSVTTQVRNTEDRLKTS